MKKPSLRGFATLPLILKRDRSHHYHGARGRFVSAKTISRSHYRDLRGAIHDSSGRKLTPAAAAEIEAGRVLRRKRRAEEKRRAKVVIARLREIKAARKPPERRVEIREKYPRSRKKADYPEGETPDTGRDKAKARFLAEHGLGELQPKGNWTRFGFPLSYNSDILEAMVALATTGAPMSAPTRAALEKPLQVIRDKRTPDEVWLMDKSLNGQMWVDVEVKGQPSKWITLFARMVLDHFGQ